MATIRNAKRKGRLDFFNVAYGVGAAIVIIGAMFKFLEWKYAYTLLAVGLSVEALVFFISAFERVYDEETYHWERLFPQLVSDEESPIQQLEAMAEKAKLDPMIIEKLASSIESLEQNVSKMNEMGGHAQLAEHLDRMKKASENFETEVSKLNSSIANMNSYYERMLKAIENRG